MRKIYSTARKLVIASLTGLALVACGPDIPKQDATSKTYSFDKPGIIDNVYSNLNFQAAISVTLGDIDGDGDSDIILADRDSGVLAIYENKIPQKR